MRHRLAFVIAATAMLFSSNAARATDCPLISQPPLPAPDCVAVAPHLPAQTELYPEGEAIVEVTVNALGAFESAHTVSSSGLKGASALPLLAVKGMCWGKYTQANKPSCYRVQVPIKVTASANGT